MDVITFSGVAKNIFNIIKSDIEIALSEKESDPQEYLHEERVYVACVNRETGEKIWSGATLPDDNDPIVQRAALAAVGKSIVEEGNAPVAAFIIRNATGNATDQNNDRHSMRGVLIVAMTDYYIFAGAFIVLPKEKGETKCNMYVFDVSEQAEGAIAIDTDILYDLFTAARETYTRKDLVRGLFSGVEGFDPDNPTPH